MSVDTRRWCFADQLGPHFLDRFGARVTIAVPWWAAGYLAVCSIALRRIDAMLSDAP